MAPKRTCGFTLTEVIVVLAVIAVLAALCLSRVCQREEQGL